MQRSDTETVFDTTGFAHPQTNVGVLGIEPGMVVADFGAGSGAYTLHIAEALQGSGHVYAVDVQKDLLRRIKNDADRRGLHNVEIIWADLEVLGGSHIANNTVDFVLISNLLFQLPDKQSIILEAARILKPTGRLAIIDWTESFGGMGPQKDDVVPPDMAISLAKAAQFEVNHEFKAGAHHYGIIFTCKTS